VLKNTVLHMPVLNDATGAFPILVQLALWGGVFAVSCMLSADVGVSRQYVS